MHSKSVFERDRRDWLVVPDAIAAYIYETVNKMSPRVGQFLADAAQTPAVVVTRYWKILCANAAIARGEKGEGGVGERTD